MIDDTAKSLELLLFDGDGRIRILNLFSEASRYEGHLANLAYKAAIGSPRDRLFFSLVKETNRAKRANIEKVMYKESALITFEERLGELLKQSLDTPRENHREKLYQLFGEYLFTNRIHISDRAYAAPIEGDGKARFYSCWGESEEEKILVGQGDAWDWFVNIDLWLTHEPTTKYLVQQYAARIERTEKEHLIDAICSIEKYAGPLGIELRNRLLKHLRALGKTVLSYSQRKKDVKLVAGPELPGPDSRMCLITDVTVTGGCLSAVKETLEGSRYRWRMPAAVLLCDLREPGLQFPEGLAVIPVIRDEHFSPEKIRENRGDKVNLEGVKLYSDDVLEGNPSAEEEEGPYEISLSPQQQAIRRKQMEIISWWETNRDQIVKGQPGKWIGVGENKEVIPGEAEQAVRRAAHAAGVTLMLITEVEPEDQIEIW